MLAVGGARVRGGVTPARPRGARVRSGPRDRGGRRAVGVTPDTRVAKASPTASSRALAMLTRCAPATMAAGVAMMPSPEQYVTERSG